MGAEMKKRLAHNQKGQAILETVALLVVFIILLSFGLGFFGVVHTAILNSISARAYAFETFRNRTPLNYYREQGSVFDPSIGPLYLGVKGFRFHAINHESEVRDKFVPTTRQIALGKTEANSNASNLDVHNQQVWEIPARNQRTDVNPVWVMVGYGLCLNANCGNN